MVYDSKGLLEFHRPPADGATSRSTAPLTGSYQRHVERRHTRVDICHPPLAVRATRRLLNTIQPPTPTSRDYERVTLTRTTDGAVFHENGTGAIREPVGCLTPPRPGH
jgi:hypothetical protein